MHCIFNTYSLAENCTLSLYHLRMKIIENVLWLSFGYSRFQLIHYYSVCLIVFLASRSKKSEIDRELHAQRIDKIKWLRPFTDISGYSGVCDQCVLQIMLVIGDDLCLYL